METLVLSQQQLELLRLRDTVTNASTQAKLWTNYLGHPTPPAIVVDTISHFLEVRNFNSSYLPFFFINLRFSTLTHSSGTSSSTFVLFTLATYSLSI